MRSAIATKIPALVVAALLLLGGTALAWTTFRVGDPGAPPRDLSLGDGDRDGDVDLWTSSQNGVHRFERVGVPNTWVQERISNHAAVSIVVGDGDRDGQPEVYVGRSEDMVQYVPDPSTPSGWRGRVIATFPGDGTLNAITLGDADSDGLVELYAGTEAANVHRVAFVGGMWMQEQVADVSSEFRITGIWAGDSDGDGGQEVVVSVSGSVGSVPGKVWKVHRPDAITGWEADLVGEQPSGGTFNAVVIGDANHDGQPEVWAVSNLGELVRFTWTGSVWQRSVIKDADFQMSDLFFADGDNDGLPELYWLSFTNGKVVQTRWTGSVWHSAVLDVIDDAWGLVVGEGDQDGRNEVFMNTLHPPGGPAPPEGEVFVIHP